MILSICDNTEVLLIFRMIKTAINIIRIAVPLILIISLMYGFLRPILSDKKDALTNESSTAIKKIIAAILVFFIPTFINLLLDMSGTKDLGITKCFSNATTQNITAAYIRNAKKYVEIANNTIDRTDYNKAKGEVSYANSQIYKMTGSENITDIPKLEGQLKEIEKKVVKKEKELEEARQKKKEEIKKNPQKYADLTDGPDKFVEAYYGRAIAWDTNYGVQCVGGFKVWCSVNGVPVQATPNDYASGYWYYKDSLGYSQYFDYIYDRNDFRNGDWVIWGSGGSHPNTHIAMYYNGQEFGQRQSCASDRSFCLANTNFNDALGALRPKVYYKK